MSRIGKQPIAIPSGIEVVVNNGIITIKKGNDTKEINTQNRVKAEVKDGSLVFEAIGTEAEDKAFWGTYRALANNAILGLSTGFTKKLEINGVGYKAAVNGNVLELALGFSHPINFEIPKGISMSVEKNVLTITGSDKGQVGQISAIVRGYRPPEPYKGKGVKYVDETIIRKAGKTSKK
ncbi:50S ribosomal protein L6 [Arcobacter sp. FWKO B]|uniref:50S ribosomal protein L6 n=1 Tax=Arcobacter sp. FWKO B TaxID=2593672 RepID=UPI0018A69333|nr:50S ribosomal protein L6 [Arcobacter sp. FWKO B]QOG11872.1 50S ribosomal protein L6 [Arcobacter sp. FWKO B]